VTFNRVISFFGLLGIVGVDTLAPAERRPLSDDPVFGPLLLVLSLIFVVCVLSMFYMAYLTARSEMAPSSSA
jgi:hypothetical protein